MKNETEKLLQLQQHPKSIAENKTKGGEKKNLSKHVQMSSPSLTYLQSCKFRSTNIIVIISSSWCSTPLFLLLWSFSYSRLFVDQTSSSFFLLLLFFFFFFFPGTICRMKLYRLLHKQCIGNRWITSESKTKKQKGVGDLARKHENSWRRKTERKRKGEHGPLDATRTPEDKTQRRVRTDGHDNNTRGRNREQYTDGWIKL